MLRSQAGAGAIGAEEALSLGEHYEPVSKFEGLKPTLRQSAQCSGAMLDVCVGVVRRGVKAPAWLVWSELEAADRPAPAFVADRLLRRGTRYKRTVFFRSGLLLELHSPAPFDGNTNDNIMSLGSCCISGVRHEGEALGTVETIGGVATCERPAHVEISETLLTS